MSTTKTNLLCVTLSAALALGCSDSDSPEEGIGSATGIDGGARDGSVREASVMDAMRPPRMDARVGRPDGGEFAMEVCDGIDNDGDGEADNVDVGLDGVCDCLLLATLGVPGIWGKGDVFADWLSQRSNTGATSLDGKTLTPELLAPFQVIVAQDLRPNKYSDAEIGALQEWIRQGGGLFTLIGYGDQSERATVNKILAPFNIQYGKDPAFKMIVSLTEPITTWYPHPVSDMVNRLGAFNGYAVEGDGGTLVAMQGGVTALRAAEIGKGHLVVWGDEWITFDTEWKDHPDYQVERFWLNSIRWLSPAKECQVSIPAF